MSAELQKHELDKNHDNCVIACHKKFFFLAVHLKSYEKESAN